MFLVCFVNASFLLYSGSMNNFYTILEEELNTLLPEIKKLKRELHMYPETAWHETETRKRLLKVLQDCSINIHTPYLNTDLIFDMEAETTENALLLRSDMDALSQQETGENPYKSLNKGAAHNCGHDGHMSMLAGAALLIDKMRKRGLKLPRPVRFVFQPAEEIECGGADLSAAGIMDGVKEVLAVHGWPQLKKGELFSKKGPFFAAAASFATEIKGKATHGGLPQNGLSPFPAAAKMINDVSAIQSRFEDKAIISSCIIRGGSSDNIIPDTIELRGTIRYYGKQHFEEIKKMFSEASLNIKKETGCTVKTDYISKYHIPLSNDGEFIERLTETLSRESGLFKEIPHAILETGAKTVSEDFAFYTDKKPGALVLLGLGDDTPALHASDFNFPEDVLIKGILLFVTTAYHLT